MQKPLRKVRPVVERQITPLVELRAVTKTYGSGVRKITAVDAVSFAIAPGEAFGLVGLSGSGKTTLGRVIMNLIRPTTGEVLFEGTRVDNLSPRMRRPFAARMQMVFQNPIASMNPRLTAAEIIERPLRAFGMGNAAERLERISDLLSQVGLAHRHAQSYPHELSGGQCQRLGIARALASRPTFMFLDEPVSALDVSVQAQILNLLKDLQQEMGFSYLVVANNINVTRFLCDRIAVLDKSRLVEIGATATVLNDPKSEAALRLVRSALVL